VRFAIGIWTPSDAVPAFIAKPGMPGGPGEQGARC
jgi:hypothetical protein